MKTESSPHVEKSLLDTTEQSSAAVQYRGLSSGIVSVISVSVMMVTAWEQSKNEKYETVTDEFDFIYEYYVTAVIISALLMLEVIHQMPFLKDLYIVTQVTMVLSLVWPNFIFISIPGATFSAAIQNSVIRSRSIARYWVILNFLSHMDRDYWRQSAIVARVCYANIVFCMLQVFIEITSVFNMVYYVLFWSYVQYICVKYLHKTIANDKERADQAIDILIVEANAEKQGRIKIETLLTRGFVILLIISSTLSLATESLLVIASQDIVSEAVLAFIITCEVFVAVVVCSILGRSEIRGVEENQVCLL